jgi:lactoylglutathione lyase
MRSQARRRKDGLGEPASPAVNGFLDHIGLVVADLAVMEDWYVRTFAMGVLERRESNAPSMRLVVLQAEAGLTIEMLCPAETPRPRELAHPTDALGWGHVCLRVDDVRESYQRLLAAGARSVVEPRAAALPRRAIAFVGDPEGNLIELIGPCAPPNHQPNGV